MKIGTAPGRCKEAGHLYFPCQPYPKTAAFVVPTRSVTMPETHILPAQHVLFFKGDVNYGVEPDAFTIRLLGAMSAANADQMRLLQTVFPLYVSAFNIRFLELREFVKKNTPVDTPTPLAVYVQQVRDAADAIEQIVRDAEASA